MRSRFVSLLSILLFSCGETSSPLQNAGNDTTETDTVNYALDSDSVKMSLKNIPPPQGFYQVMLPCTDCRGIEHTVHFRPDLSYRLEETEAGTGKKIRTVNGNWKPSEGDIWLYQDSAVQARYTWRRDTLHYIDLKTSVLIPMRNLKDAASNETWKAKKEEGIEFFGVGNEPFWNITIDNKKRIAFHLSEWAGPIQLKTARQTTAKDSSIYTTSNDSVQLRLVVYNTFCSDGMSDYIYNNKIRVVYNRQVYHGCGVYLKNY